MKNRLITILCLGILIAACSKENKTVTPANPGTKPATHSGYRFNGDTSDINNSRFITMATANTMISSYLYSINANANDSDIRSFSLDADSLRAYLANTSIKHVKIIFAHTMDYVDAGYGGQYAGYQGGAMTLILAGYDASGNYQYYNGKVLDHAAPCPYTCPGGNAGYDLLQ